MLSRIKDRKIVQWVAAYAVAAWVIIQVVEVVSEGFRWSETPLRVAIILALVGAPIVAVLGWYHGEKGRQRVTREETFVLGALTCFGVVVLVAFGAPATTGGKDPGPDEPAALDSLRYVVLPFEVDADVLGGHRVDLLVHDALAKWLGIELVDLFQVRDAMLSRPASEDGAAASGDPRAVAVRLGAGRHVRGYVSAVAESIRIEAALYDTRSGRLLANARVNAADPEAVSDSLAASLVSALLFEGVGSSSSPEIPHRTTRSYPAILAFARAHEALGRWKLGAADSLFAVAVREDPELARAQFWRAQIQHWSGVRPAALRPILDRALSRAETLTPRERALATALDALAVEDYLAACQAYDALRANNERDFAAWFGLGECRIRDPVVVPDPRSPSGWSFRGSGHLGTQAYVRAFRLLPSVHLSFESHTLERADQTLFLRAAAARRGRAATSDTVFLALAGLEADTLSFVPYPLSAYSEGGQGPWPRDHWGAVQRQRQAFLGIATAWTTAFPESPFALEALVLARELVGDPRALSTVREARARATDPQQRTRLAAREAVLLVKFGNDYGRVRELADSILSSTGFARADDTVLSGLAALLGRVHESAGIAGRAAEPLRWTTEIPLALTRPAAELLVYAAFGGPADSLRSRNEALRTGLEHAIPAEARTVTRHALVDRAAALAFPVFGFPDASLLARTTPYPVLRAQAAVATGELERARAVLAELQQSRANLRPSELALESVLPEARLRVALGDTASAVTLLDATLAGLRWNEPGLLGEGVRLASGEPAVRAASLVGIMALRAELAHRSGEGPVAARWAAAVTELWSGGDAQVRPVLARMRTMLSASPVPR